MRRSKEQTDTVLFLQCIIVSNMIIFLNQPSFTPCFEFLIPNCISKPNSAVLLWWNYLVTKSADAGGNLIMWDAREGERRSMEKRGNIQTQWPSAMKLSLKCCSIIRGSKKEDRELILEFHCNTLLENLHWTKNTETINRKTEEEEKNSMYVLYTMILDMK